MSNAGPRFGPLQVAIIFATVVTAGVHLFLFVSGGGEGGLIQLGFLVASIGFMGSLVALFLPGRPFDTLRSSSRLALLGVTVATMSAYVVVMGWTFDTLAIMDKIDESLLVALLVADAVATHSRAGKGAEREPHLEVRRAA